MLATVPVLLVIVSFVYVGVGLVAGFLGVGLTVTVPVFVVMTLVLTWLSRLIHHMDHLAPQPGEADIFEGVMISKGASREEGLVALREMLRGPGKD
jgi:hypothetical protein